MKMKSFVCCLCCVGLVLASSAAGWAASVKIGYFDFQVVLEKSKWGQKVKQQMEQEKTQARAEVEKKQQELKAMGAEFEKKKLMLDDAAKSKKVKELVEAEREYQKLVMETNSQLNKHLNELTKPMFEEVMAVVRKIAQSEKYDYILEAGKGGVAYATEKLNLTDRIISDLDKATPK